MLENGSRKAGSLSVNLRTGACSYNHVWMEYGLEFECIYMAAVRRATLAKHIGNIGKKIRSCCFENFTCFDCINPSCTILFHP